MKRVGLQIFPIPAFALVAAPRTSRCDDDEPPPTLRQWLARARFGLAISQGWGCEAQSLGALLALQHRRRRYEYKEALPRRI